MRLELFRACSHRSQNGDVENSDLSEILQRLFFFVALIISLFIIATYALSMGLGIVVMFSTVEGLGFSQSSIAINPLLLADLQVSVNAGLYFMFLWWIFAICFAAAWRYKESLSSKLRELRSGHLAQRAFRNNLLAMPIITTMLLVAVYVLHFLQSQGGIPTGDPQVNDPFTDFLQFSRAPFVEELLFRIFPIGSFLAAYIFAVMKSTNTELSRGQRLKACFLSILQPERAKQYAGLKTISEGGLFGGGMSWAEWIMVVFTASLFGIAHYLGGWGPGKISQAGLSGLVFALAYLYYGAQAPFLLHWYSNYYFTVFNLSASYLSGIDFGSVVFSANLFLGAFMWIGFTFLVLLIILSRLLKS